jgi:iron complex outermembrane recepter protein
MGNLLGSGARRLGQFVVSAAVIGAFGGVTQVAIGQQSVDPSDAVSEVVVTAQYRRENLQETPLAITAVSGEMLERRGQTSSSK